MNDPYIGSRPLKGLGMDEVVRLRRELGDAEMGWNKRAERAEAEIERLRARVSELVMALDRQLGTPCEQIRHQQEVEKLEAVNAELLAALKEIAVHTNSIERAQKIARAVIARAEGDT